MNLRKSSKLKTFDFIGESLRKVAFENSVDWSESFLKWEARSCEYDFSTNLAIIISFKLGKDKKETFREIRKSIETVLNHVSLIETESGYLNFVLEDKFYEDFINEFLRDPFPLFYKREHVVNVEFVSVNPTGYLHLGHLRNALIGDAVANIYKFIGFKVFKEYYVNDRGKQVETLVRSVIFHLKEVLKVPLKASVENFKNQDLYYGKSIEDLSSYLMTEKVLEQEKMTLDGTEIRDIAISFFVSKIKSELEMFGISFDRWFSEKEMYLNKSYVEEKLTLLLGDSNSYRKDGAVFLRTSSFGDEKDRVIVKEDGEFTYFLSDILYHLDKIERSDTVVNIWGSDHHGYVERIRGALKILGFERVEEKLKIVLIQMVSLLTPSGSKKFSKRLGNTIGLEEVLLSIKKDQLKFSLLETDSNNHLLINTEILNKENKDSKLYYVQYAHARCNQIINSWRNLVAGSSVKTCKVNSFMLVDKKEKNLIKEISKFEGMVLRSAEQKSPHIILKHVYLISSDFHSYYQSVPILTKCEINVREQRVTLVKAVKKVLEAALKIFSIEPIKFMNRGD